LDYIIRSRVDMYSRDGIFYGVCAHVGAAVHFYNTAILEEAGIDYRDIITWDDFREAGERVLEVVGVPMVTFEATDTFGLHVKLAQLGSDFLTEDNEYNINTPEMIHVLTWSQDMIRDGLAIVAPGGFHHAEEYYGFMNAGGAASIGMPQWYLQRFRSYMPDLHGQIRLAPSPVWEVGQQRSLGLGGTGHSVTNQTEHPDLVKDFLAFSKLTPRGSAYFWTWMGTDPIFKEIWRDESVVRAENAFTDYFGIDLFDVLIEIEDEIPAPILTDRYPSVVDMMRTVVLPRVLLDMEDPATVLEEAQGILEAAP